MLSTAESEFKRFHCYTAGRSDMLASISTSYSISRHVVNIKNVRDARYRSQRFPIADTALPPDHVVMLLPAC